MRPGFSIGMLNDPVGWKTGIYKFVLYILCPGVAELQVVAWQSAFISMSFEQYLDVRYITNQVDQIMYMRGECWFKMRFVGPEINGK